MKHTPSMDEAYTSYYEDKHSIRHTYPVEFVVRTLLGTYPNLRLDQQDYVGRKILDIGFGDGRNFPLLHNLGFEISGVEISDKILQLAQNKFRRLNIPVDLRRGSNSELPFNDGAFEYVLACHSIYYVKEGETFQDNLNEVARIMAPNGIFVASPPRENSYILHEARKLGNQHVRITHDPLGLRRGSIFRVFQSEADILDTFLPYFENFSLGYCDDNFYGLQQNVWIIVCARRAP